MIQTARLTCSLAVAAFLLAPCPALAHGGYFRPPPPPEKPNRPRPAPPSPPRQPPSSGGGVCQPGPNTPGPSGPSAPGPSTPGPTGPTAPGNPYGGPSTPFSSVPEITDWSWWWAFNEDPYVDLRRRLRTSDSMTGTEEFYIGEGMRPQEASLSPGRDLIQSRIGPALTRIFDETRSSDLRAAAVVSLAKLHPTYLPPEGSPLSRPMLALQDPDRDVVQAAMLALGLIAEPDCARVLCDLAAGSDEAAVLLQRSSVAEVFRVQAALAAGLVGARSENEEVRRYVVHRLSQVLDERLAAPDLHIACLTSIGLSPLADSDSVIPEPRKRGKRGDRRPQPAASRLGQVLFLLEIFEDPKRREYVRAHVPKALGLLAREACVPVNEHVKQRLLERLGARKQDKRLVRYGIVEGLGLVGDSDVDELDVELRKALRGVVRDGDYFERNLALLSLAFASSRPGNGAGQPLEGLRGEQVFLMKQFAQGKDRMRPWAGLALGLQGYHARAAGGTLFDSNGQALRKIFERTRSSSDAAALGIALGLRRDADSIPLLLERLEETNDDDDRGLVAVALGLSGGREAIEPLEEIVRDSRYHPMLLRDAAVGLALLGSRSVTDDLISILKDAKSSAVRAGVVSAIGFVGDVRSVEPLVELLEDSGQSDSLRTSAATALGIVCEEESLPWAASFTNKMNYTARTETLISGDGSGFLNLP